jgi:hypothetical protein
MMDNSPIARTFTLTENQMKKAYEWQRGLEADLLKKGELRTCQQALGYGGDEPYYGAIGGELTFVFVPNSIGCVELVRYKDQELDLTDYNSW